MPNLKTIRSAPASASKTSTAVLGHDVAGPRLTVAGVFWLLVYLGLPVLVLGNLLDWLVQWSLGWCVGVWCIASR